jgi:hypothetical protein
LFLWRFLVLDTEPFDPPSLDGISHVEFEVLGLRMNRDDSTADIMDLFLGDVAPQAENVLPKTPRGINTQESFT